MCRSSPGFISASKVKSFLISQDKKHLRALNCHWYTYTLCTIAFFATVLFQNQTKPRKPVHVHLKYKTSTVFGKIQRCFQRLKQWHLIEKNSLLQGKLQEHLLAVAQLKYNRSVLHLFTLSCAFEFSSTLSHHVTTSSLFP